VADISIAKKLNKTLNAVVDLRTRVTPKVQYCPPVVVCGAHYFLQLVRAFSVSLAGRRPSEVFLS